MIDTPVLLAAAAILLTGWLAAKVFPARVALAADQWLRHRRAPLVVGVLTACTFAWVAGATFDVEPISTDEASYLLQAEIFAAGRLTAPAPPIPEFFEQVWVMVSPRIYSKYPPGHALALAPGVALGLPWLVPFLLNIVNGALLFALIRRATGPAPALLTWSAWILSGMAMAWQTSYFSEVTLMACWLGAVASGWRWLDGHGTRWLVGASLLVGYGVLTRPLSILLLVLPLALVVAHKVINDPTSRRAVLLAAGAGGAVLLFLPLWNLGTTGSATRSPLREYTETYLPWDRLGFAIESTAARRPAPPDLAPIAAHLARVHREHTVERLPRTLLERGDRVRGILFTHWRLVLLLPTILGLFALGRAGWLAMTAPVAQWLGHAVWGHEAGWTLYYAESAALWFLPGAVGVVMMVRWLARRLRDGADLEHRVALAALLAAPAFFALSIQDSAFYRRWRMSRAAESRAFTEHVEAGPARAIYFVRYGPPRSGRPGLVRNSPWLAESQAWIVYDLGARNRELLDAALDRTPFLVDVDRRSVTPLPASP